MAETKVDSTEARVLKKVVKREVATTRLPTRHLAVAVFQGTSGRYPETVQRLQSPEKKGVKQGLPNEWEKIVEELEAKCGERKVKGPSCL